MNGEFKLRIARSCSERWEAMSLVPKGRFCGRCSKTVIDFTPMNDDCIIRILQNSKGEICGRLRADQSDRSLQPSAWKPAWPGRMQRFIAALFLLLSAREAQGQLRSGHPVEQKEISRDEKPHEMITIKGVVVDSLTGDALSFATLWLENSDIGCTTGIDGNFCLKVRIEDRTDSLYLMISYAGYNTRRVLVPLAQANADTTIGMEPEEPVRLVPQLSFQTIGAIYYERPGRLTTLRKRFFAWFRQ